MVVHAGPEAAAAVLTEGVGRHRHDRHRFPGRARIARVASSPFISGICMSIRISGSPLLPLSTACQAIVRTLATQAGILDHPARPFLVHRLVFTTSTLAAEALASALPAARPPRPRRHPCLGCPAAPAVIQNVLPAGRTNHADAPISRAIRRRWSAPALPAGTAMRRLTLSPSARRLEQLRLLLAADAIRGPPPGCAAAAAFILFHGRAFTTPPARARELHGVAQQVEQHLPQPQRVPRAVRQALPGAPRGQDPSSAPLPPVSRTRGDQLRRRSRRSSSLRPSADARDVQHVVDDFQQVLPRLAAQLLDLLGVRRPASGPARSCP